MVRAFPSGVAEHTVRLEFTQPVIAPQPVNSTPTPSTEMNLMKASAVAVGLAVILAALAGPANSDGTYSCYDSAGCSSNACIDGGKQCHNDFDCQGTCGSCKQCWAWGCGFLGIYWDCGKNCAKCGGSCSSTSNYCSSRSGCYTTCQCSSSSCGSNQYLSGCGGSSSGTCTTCGSCPPGQERQGCYGLNSGSCNSCPSIPSGAWFTGSGCSYEACPSGESNCGSPTRDGKACANLQTNQWHCGACNRACPSGQICTQGSCACPSGTSMCGSTCLDLQSDKKNCGTCGTPCSAGKICSSGTCVCESGLTDCSGNCVDLKASFSHCGGCGTACPVNQTCLGGSCGCPNSQTYCGDNCFDTLTETKHCGACSKACPATQICSSGTCVCPIGLAYCADSGLCSDHKTDTGNCGACSKRCGRGQTCENATCICPSGLSYCASVDSCIDLQSDTQNCGSCGSVCPAEATRCSAGQCRLATFSAEPAGAPMVSDNTTALGLMQGSNFGISTARGGLACTPKCAINAAAKRSSRFASCLDRSRLPQERIRRQAPRWQSAAILARLQFLGIHQAAQCKHGRRDGVHLGAVLRQCRPRRMRKRDCDNVELQSDSRKWNEHGSDRRHCGRGSWRCRCRGRCSRRRLLRSPPKQGQEGCINRI
ncbi:hypothetical protein DFJ74DRAFT_504415 [Hyaloraphidium curvatum]|nr:hypothetical protein DFJ74DRAFT_504415 [Hyaloraphidium curvatum]